MRGNRDVWYDEELEVRRKPRKKNNRPLKIVKPERWTISEEELATLAGISPEVLSEWRGRGLLGKPDPRNKYDIDLNTAQRVVLMSRLVAVGIHPNAAGHIVAAHSSRDLSPLVVEFPGGVTVTVNRADLIAS